MTIFKSWQFWAIIALAVVVVYLAFAKQNKAKAMPSGNPAPATTADKV